MPRFICILVVSLLTLSLQTTRAESPLPFSVGERLDFKVYFEFILGGTSQMSVKSIEEVNGQPCYQFVSEARSTKTVDMMYKVRDRIVSYRDVEGGFSRRFIKRLREGDYRDDKTVEYLPEEDRALLYRGEKDEEPDTLEVKGAVQDVLSALYYAREAELEVGKSVFIDVHDINKRYLLELRVLRREKVDVPAGSFTCFVVQPELQSSGVFRKEGELQIWLTDDQHRIPVLMKSRLYFGRVWAKLVGYRLGDAARGGE